MKGTVVSHLHLLHGPVERHAQMNHEVGAAYVSCTWNPIFEFLVHDPFQFDDPLLEVFFGYGLQTLCHLVETVHGKSAFRPHNRQWHSTLGLNLAL